MDLKEAFRNNPFVRITILFMIGILLSSILSFGLIYSLFSFFLILLVFSIYPKKTLNSSWIRGIGLSLIFINFGFIHALLFKVSDEQKILPEEKTVFLAQILEILKYEDDQVKAEIHLEAHKNKDHWNPLNTKALGYLKTNNKDSISIGQCILFSAKPYTIKNNGNPKEFDYQKYYNRDGIFYRMYINEDELFVLKEMSRFSLLLEIKKIRHSLLQRLKASSISEVQAGIISALILGYRGYLDDETKNIFVRSGAMHILAVSGMHVGIIYILLTFIFQPGRKNANPKMHLIPVYIIFLWGYACITGLSPSVIRATTMFTLLIIGKGLNRQISIYNIIFATAFINLFFNPGLLYDTGFQLSYLAVLGIVSFQPAFYSVASFKSNIVDKLWLLISVSLAAQLGVFPLSIFYFHQFSTCFLITNLVVLPLMGIVIYSGILILILLLIDLQFPVLTELYGKLIDIIVYILKTLGNLPLAQIENIGIDLLSTWLLYIIILLFWILITTRVRIMTHLILAMILLLQSIGLLHHVQLRKSKWFIVFNISGSQLYNFLDAQKNIALYDSFDPSSTKLFNIIARNFWINLSNEKPVFINRRNIHECITKDLYMNGSFVYYAGMRIFILDGPFPGLDDDSPKVDVNFILVSKNAQFGLDQISKHFSYQKIIFDSSVPSYRLSKWRNECCEMGVAYHVVSEAGAFIYRYNPISVIKK